MLLGLERGRSCQAGSVSICCIVSLGIFPQDQALRGACLWFSFVPSRAPVRLSFHEKFQALALAGLVHERSCASDHDPTGGACRIVSARKGKPIAGGLTGEETPCGNLGAMCAFGQVF